MVIPIVLLDNASVPANVDTVPVVGRVKLVLPVVVRVRAFAPLVVKLPARSILPANLIVLAALIMSRVSMRPAVNAELETAASVTSKAALVSRIDREVRESAVPPLMSGVVRIGVTRVRLALKVRPFVLSASMSPTELVFTAAEVLVESPTNILYLFNMLERAAAQDRFPAPSFANIVLAAPCAAGNRSVCVVTPVGALMAT